MMARTGRRPGDSDTRASILVAARTAFGERGFDQSTIRGIAEVAAVDPALIHHYFGTKADLYAAAIEIPLSPSVVTAAVMADGIDQAGANLARAFFSIWEDPLGREPLLGMLRGAITGNDAGVQSFRQFIGAVLITAIAEHVDAPDSTLRVELAASHLVGIAVIRYVIQLEPLSSTPVDDIVAMVAPRLQSYLTG